MEYKKIAKELSKPTAAKSHFFQPKLTINQPNDVHEREADQMADKVMRMAFPLANQNSFFKPADNSVQRKCQACENEDKHVHRKESNTGDAQGGSELDSYVSSLNASGQAMPAASRSFFEPRFGRNFSDVRIHTDAVAAKSAQSINALAYTTGNNIVFNTGQYSPDSDNGKKLMAHELTHVVQQGGSNKSVQTYVAPELLPPTGPVAPPPVAAPPGVAPPSVAPPAAAPLSEGAGTVAEEEIAAGAGESLLGTLLPVAAFLAVLLYPSSTAPAWMDEINPITHQPYKSKQEYDQVKTQRYNERNAPTAAGPTPTTAPATATAPAPKLPLGTGPAERKLPTQTCNNATLDRLQALKDSICNTIPGDSCSPSKVSPKKLDKRPCSEIKTRIQAMEDCKKIRQVIQDECFGGVPDKAHEKPFTDLDSGIEACRKLALVNCAPGHPMAKL